MSTKRASLSAFKALFRQRFCFIAKFVQFSERFAWREIVNFDLRDRINECSAFLFKRFLVRLAFRETLNHQRDSPGASDFLLHGSRALRRKLLLGVPHERGRQRAVQRQSRSFGLPDPQRSHARKRCAFWTALPRHAR